MSIVSQDTKEKISADKIIPSSQLTNSAPVFDAPTTSSPHNLLIIGNKSITHRPHAGVNPLVDSASYLFTAMGKLRQMKNCHDPEKLQKELIDEIRHFQEASKANGYSIEYTVVSRYILCAALDDIIFHSPWGSHGEWDQRCLLSAFKQENTERDRFFIILERITKEPATYLDLMELMYLCLNLGFKGSFRFTEHGNLQLEQIMDALYKHVRHHRGDFSKTLSPYSFKTTQKNHSHAEKPLRPWHLLLPLGCFLFCLLLGIGYEQGILHHIVTTTVHHLVLLGRSG